MEKVSKKSLITVIVILGIIIAALSGVVGFKFGNNIAPKTGFVLVHEDDEGKIFFDKDTGVIYVQNKYSITPVYNADGTLKNVKEYRNDRS